MVALMPGWGIAGVQLVTALDAFVCGDFVSWLVGGCFGAAVCWVVVCWFLGDVGVWEFGFVWGG